MHAKDNDMDGLAANRGQPEHAGSLSRAFDILANLPDDFLRQGRGDVPAQMRQPDFAD